MGDNKDAALVNPQNTPTFSIGYAPASALNNTDSVLGGATVLEMAPLVYGKTWDKCKKPLMEWFGQAGWQHTSAYVKYLGLDAVVAATQG